MPPLWGFIMSKKKKAVMENMFLVMDILVVQLSFLVTALECQLQTYLPYKRLEDSRFCKSTCYGTSYGKLILFKGYLRKYNEED